MKEIIRVARWRVGKKIGSRSMMEKVAPHYYQYAKERIACDCSKCKCPAQSACSYSFVYIDERSKLMYFDVPKAASTTIRKAFFKNKAMASLRNPRKELDQYYKFTFVRNPWDRMVSNWKMFTTQPSRMKQLEVMTNADLSDFESFVSFAIDCPNHHWQPQALFTPEPLDFVGKLESFDEDMNRLLSHLGRTPLALGKQNSTRRKGYRDYYSPTLVEVVADYYRRDIESFGYEF
ncbi:sulfotransferase family 2 domain-containing protein [Verrucomicrobiaceae bacterium N1E253]|uniref:Sulfotransferase family 2 domain-containing protein n=1 Tax=Oceaniferula marina TaxID=2748318 RepID=A0A851GHY1_9BACT|nr:sulfotransferase family 2 domain-containing protein [Oceaniferula marina]NWK56809.1 sulfotransferase family 2 domain-containing protein [Oceaniferula marina]